MRISALWVLGCFLLLSAPVSAAPAYSLLDLGPVAGYSITGGEFLNDSGQVAFIGPQGAIRYTDGTGPELLAPESREVGGINNRGEVSLVQSDGAISRFTDSSGLGVVSRFIFPTTLTGPNTQGDISFSCGPFTVYIRDGSEIGLVDYSWGMPDIYLFDMNDSGDVLFTWANSPGAYVSNPSEPIRVARPLWSAAAINNRGDIAGWVDGWASVLWANGTLETISPGVGFIPSDINENGDIVGFRLLGGYDLPWMWSSGHPVDLNSAIDRNLGWTLTTASGINNVGQIAGVGLFNGQRRAYRLTPL